MEVTSRFGVLSHQVIPYPTYPKYPPIVAQRSATPADAPAVDVGRRHGGGYNQQVGNVRKKKVIVRV